MNLRQAGWAALLLLLACRSPELPDRPPPGADAKSSLEYSPVPPPLPPARWSVSLRTSGGFTGTGQGAVIVSSNDGVAPRFPCKLPEDKFLAVERAVAGAEPHHWAPSYRVSPPRWTDQFSYSLVLTVGDGEESESTHRTAWRGDAEEELPEDLRRLGGAMVDALRVTRDCR